MKTISKLKKELDKWFSLYIRLRDANEYGMVQCFTSGRVYHYKNIHAGHFMSRKHLSTRWCDTNVQPQSAADNLFGQGEQYKFALHLDGKFGEGYFNNCVGCFHRNPIFLNKMAQEHKNKMEWFSNIEQENSPNTFRKDCTYKEILEYKPQIELSFEDFDDCDSGFCGL